MLFKKIQQELKRVQLSCFLKGVVMERIYKVTGVNRGPHTTLQTKMKMLQSESKKEQTKYQVFLKTL